ncbi:elongation factor G, partial [bacterium]
KLKETNTGDTLCDLSNQVIFDPIVFAEPLISYAVNPKTKGEEQKVSTGLHNILHEDPTLKLNRDKEANEIILSGMGQMHIEIALQKLKRKFGVEVEIHSPMVPYRESITTSAKAQGKYKKQSGGRGQYGDCWIEIKPLPKGSGFKFVDKIVSGTIPKQYIPAVETGIVEKMKQGVFAGYPLIDIEVRLYDGSFHTVDSSELAFKIAGSFAIKNAVAQANPILLEPIMKVEIDIPEDSMGAVIGDLNAKRGKVQGVNPMPGSSQKINALVPLAEMLTYANQLQSITSGQGVYTMEFYSYEEVPYHIAEKIAKERNKTEQAEAKT